MWCDRNNLYEHIHTLIDSFIYLLEPSLPHPSPAHTPIDSSLQPLPYTTHTLIDLSHFNPFLSLSLSLSHTHTLIHTHTHTHTHSYTHTHTYTPQRSDYLHRKLYEALSDFPNVYFPTWRMATIWGGASLLQMLLRSMEDLENVLTDWKWDYLINLSESDFPLQ